MPTAKSSVAAGTAGRFASVNLTVTTPESSLVIATPVMSGALSESAPGSKNDVVFAAKAAPAQTTVKTPATASARQIDPFIRVSVAHNSANVTARFPPPSRRRRRLPRTPCVPRTPEDVQACGRATGQRLARLLELHRASLAVRGTARSGRRLGLAGDADVPARALRGLPVGARVRRRPARAARSAS